MDKRVLVIIPAYNEEENIVRVVDNLINNYDSWIMLLSMMAQEIILLNYAGNMDIIW